VKLRELHGRLIHHVPPGGEYLSGGHRYVDTLPEADGVFFLCPLCFQANGGPVGTHGVLLPFSNAPAGAYPMKNAAGMEPRWSASGTSLDDLVCTPSIQLLGGGCAWHGFIGSNGVPPGEAA